MPSIHSRKRKEIKNKKNVFGRFFLWWWWWAENGNKIHFEMNEIFNEINKQLERMATIDGAATLIPGRFRKCWTRWEDGKETKEKRNRPNLKF
jgi:hypothetical protein